jgi:UDP-N-acetylglucosamine 2-epimerase (non-hydrolysing)
LETENPDAFLVLGDTNSCLSVLSAKKRKIPIFHLEAGNRCFDERVPEEINRRLIDHISDVNFTYSEISRGYLIREGCDPFFIVKLGSPMKEVMKAQEEKIMSSSVISKLKLSKQEYIVMSIHRDENVSDELTLKNVCEIIDYIYNELNIQIVLTLHPKTSDMLKKYIQFKIYNI